MESFGRYQLLERIAVGGMAEIFLARTASIDGFEKDLVIKRIRPEFGKDERFSSMFIDEARLSMTLSHPNIVQVFDFGHTDGAYYLGMEHIDGCDLDTIADLDEIRGRGMEPGLALLIMQDVCRGLDYSHNKTGRRGEPLTVIHRDISPQNIMVTFEGGTKITDFGIAKARGKVSVTEPGMVLGKLAYMSPEHATGMEIDRRADIFACGVVLWEMLCGRRVYEGESGTRLYDRIRTADIKPPSAYNKELRKLDRLVLKAVAPIADERYQTAREFGADIHAYLAKKFPEANNYSLQEYMQAQREQLDVIGFDDIEDTMEPRALAKASAAARVARPASAPAPAPTPVVAPAPTVVPAPAPAPAAAKSPPTAAAFDFSPALIKIVERFRAQPSLWHLVQMGDTCLRSRQPAAALTAYRVASVKFAQRGLFAQSLLCSARMTRLRPFEELRAEFEALPALAGQPNSALRGRLFRTRGELEDLLAELLTDTSPGHGLVGEGTPLLRNFDGKAFAAFVQAAPLRLFPADAPVVAQGDSGGTMYLIAKGRTLVYATRPEGERIYLSSLTAGDIFGENAFFTGAPRSATVEALYPVEAFEIDQSVYENVMRGVPQANEILLRFYKDRIVDVVLAKSPIFSLLPNEDRRAMLDRFDVAEFQPGAAVISEGSTSDQIYIIKNGEAEVWTERDGKHETLASLGPGRMFGEVAALRGIPRTASVSARSKLEALRLSGAEFLKMLEGKPDLRQRVNDEIATRVRENIDRLVAFRPKLSDPS